MQDTINVTPELSVEAMSFPLALGPSETENYESSSILDFGSSILDLEFWTVLKFEALRNAARTNKFPNQAAITDEPCRHHQPPLTTTSAPPQSASTLFCSIAASRRRRATGPAQFSFLF
jgi:hypothetical protein